MPVPQYIMWTINSILTALFDVVYALLGPIHPAVPLVVISVVFGVVALVVIKYCSNQSAVGRVKDKIKANMLAIKLYKDELGVMFRSFAVVIGSALKLQLLMIPPLLVMIIPMVLVCAQMAAHQEWRPLQVGERGVLLVTLDEDLPDSALDIKPQVPEGVTLDTRCRCAEANEVAWNVQASKPGRYTLGFPVGDRTITKELVVGRPLERVSSKRHRGGWLDSFLYACEKPLAADSGVRTITITMPPLDSRLYGSFWWIIWFLVLSIAVALILKPIFKVKI